MNPHIEATTWEGGVGSGHSARGLGMGCSSLGGGVGSAGPRGDPNRGLLGRRGGVGRFDSLLGAWIGKKSGEIQGLGSGKNQGKSK